LTWAIEQRGNQNNDILNTLYQLEGKYKNLINVIWGRDTREEADPRDTTPEARAIAEEKEANASPTAKGYSYTLMWDLILENESQGLIKAIFHNQG
jgi:hypothetical protein